MPIGEWTPIGAAHVLYLSPEAYTRREISAALAELRPDLVYAQSYFSPLVSILPRILKRTGRLRSPLLVAPRGEFSPGALALKGAKKRAFLQVGRVFRLDQGILWHATAPEEAEEIRRTIGPGAEILLAPPLPTADDRPLASRTKVPGELEAVFVSRITPKKNLLGAIEILAGVSGVRLTAYGPKEDAAYWALCEARARETGVALVDGGTLAPEEVRGAFERAHLFLFPTLGENYGHVVMEALTAGTPVLLSDRTPWRNLREEGIGWDIPLGETASFQSALQEMLAMDAEAFSIISRRAFEAAKARRHNPELFQMNRNLLQQALLSGR